MTLASVLPAAARSSAAVVICCYSEERWSTLNRAILSAVAQVPAPAEVVVVVDHNPVLAERLRCVNMPGVRVVENTDKRGLSGARNTGIAETNADSIMFLDDDAVADEQMLEALVSCAERPGVLGAMATIRPSWEGLKPAWFPGEFLWTVGCVYKGLAPGVVRNLIGAAMLVRRNVFETVGGFDQDFGRKEISLPLGCEETELCIRARAAFPGDVFIFDASSGCDHLIPRRRATLRYLLQRCWAEGLSKAALSKVAGAKMALASERHYTMRVLPRGFFAGLADTILRFEAAGILRSFAILAGLFSATAGYAYGRLKAATAVPRAPFQQSQASIAQSSGQSRD